MACLRWFGAVVLGLSVTAMDVRFARETAHAQAPEAEDVAEGMRLFRTKGDCQSCHGWAADGKKMDTQMPDGANLRTTRLSRELLSMIKCGRPGKACRRTIGSRTATAAATT
jgi:mono/diheme cytochrome c family protein